MEEVKEWVSVKSGPNGTFVTVSLVQGNLASKRTVKSYGTGIKQSVLEARKTARQFLDELMEAVA